MAHQSVITIDGIKYIVTKRVTLAQIAKTRPNTARNMRQNGGVAELVLKRPNGRVIYWAIEFKPLRGFKRYSKVLSLGRPR